MLTIATENLPVLLLIGSIGILVASTALMYVSIPKLWWRRRQPRLRLSNPVHATHRRPIALPRAGRPMPLALPPASGDDPHRQSQSTPDTSTKGKDLSEAEATIELLLDIDPERIARTMTQWINESGTDDTMGGRR